MKVTKEAKVPETYPFDKTLQLLVIGEPVDEDRHNVSVQVEQGWDEVDEDGFAGGEQSVVTRVAGRGWDRSPGGEVRHATRRYGPITERSDGFGRQSCRSRLIRLNETMVTSARR